MTEIQARRHSYRRQLLGGAAPDAATALRAVVGVYSSHPTAPLTLRARCAAFDQSGFRALDALRLPAMRGSIHLLPRETAHLAFRAVPEPSAASAARLRNFGLSEERYAALREAVLAAAIEPRTARELREATGAGDELKGVIGTMTREGMLARVGADGLRSNALRYVAADVPEADAERALAWLAAGYLRSFGPARVEDFRWWAGVAKERASTAMNGVETVEVGDGYLLPAEDLEAFETAPDPRGVDLLPKWDCYTMGYAPDGRRRFAHPDVQDRLYDFRGDGRGAVLVDGEAAGAWEMRFDGTGSRSRMQVSLDLFDDTGARLKKAIEDEFHSVAALLGARDMYLTPVTFQATKPAHQA